MHSLPELRRAHHDNFSPPWPAKSTKGKRGDGCLTAQVLLAFWQFSKVKQSISDESQFGLICMSLFHSQGWVIVNQIEEAGSSNRKKIKTVEQNKAEKTSYTSRYTPIGGWFLVCFHTQWIHPNLTEGLLMTLKARLNLTPMFVQCNIQAIWSRALGHLSCALIQKLIKRDVTSSKS